MRFKEFLFERQVTDLESVIQQIRSNCKPFLKQGRMLYRGFSPFLMKETGVEKFDPSVAFYSPHPTSRKPRDSAKAGYFNFMFNGGVELAFDIENVRSRTIFATNNPAMAMIFGEVTFFFPCGDYRFLTSHTMSDSFEDNSKIRALVGNAVGLESNKIRQGFDLLATKYKSGPHEWLANPEKALAPTMEAFGSDDEQLYFRLKDALNETYSAVYDNNPSLGHYTFPTSGGELMFYETHGYYTVPAKMVMADMNAKGIDHAGIPEDELVKKHLRELIVSKTEDEV
jgi:hypothetical protein